MSLSPDRYSARRCRGQNRNTFHQDILSVVVRHPEHVVVRAFHLNCARELEQHTHHFHRFASGTLGPVTFGLGLRDSCLVILFFNLLTGVPPAYL